MKKNPMTIYFYKTGESNGSNYVKIPLRTNAVLNIENNDKNCFIWSTVASLHPCKNKHPKKVSNYETIFQRIKLSMFRF